MLEVIKKVEKLEDILGKDDRRTQVLKNADRRCLETGVNPCAICRIQDMVSLVRDISTAKAMAEICCPSGKMPVYLERKLAIVVR